MTSLTFWGLVSVVSLRKYSRRKVLPLPERYNILNGGLGDLSFYRERNQLSWKTSFQLFITMEGLKDFTGEGFFEMEEVEQKRYENMIFNICNEILVAMEKEFPHQDVKHIYTNNLRELERHFILEEDYEMSYLINNTINRLNNE